MYRCLKGLGFMKEINFFYKFQCNFARGKSNTPTSAAEGEDLFKNFVRISINEFYKISSIQKKRLIVRKMRILTKKWMNFCLN